MVISTADNLLNTTCKESRFWRSSGGGSGGGGGAVFAAEVREEGSAALEVQHELRVALGHDLLHLVHRRQAAHGWREGGPGQRETRGVWPNKVGATHDTACSTFERESGARNT